VAADSNKPPCLLMRVGLFIQQVGFPVAAAVYLLWRMDTLLRDIDKSLSDLIKALHRIQMLLERMPQP